MTEPKLADSLINLSRALDRLREALAVPSDQSLAVDGTIQRFEFVIELCWKTLRRVLAFEGIDTTTPREAVVQAFAIGLIDNETAWLDMLRDRNRAAHVYDEAMALALYQRIRLHAADMEDLVQRLVERYP
jgi:nucleotidyltransferase substrate binding protein (TIGR01987 family)